MWLLKLIIIILNNFLFCKQYIIVLLQWNDENRTYEIRIMLKSERSIVRTSLVRILNVRFIRSFGFRRLWYRNKKLCLNPNVRTILFGFWYSFLFQAIFGTELKANVREPNMFGFRHSTVCVKSLPLTAILKPVHPSLVVYCCKQSLDSLKYFWICFI